MYLLAVESDVESIVVVEDPEARALGWWLTIERDVLSKTVGGYSGVPRPIVEAAIDHRRFGRSRCADVGPTHANYCGEREER
jgi:hypothetical protein